MFDIMVERTRARTAHTMGQITIAPFFTDMYIRRGCTPIYIYIYICELYIESLYHHHTAAATVHLVGANQFSTPLGEALYKNQMTDDVICTSMLL